MNLIRSLIVACGLALAALTGASAPAMAAPGHAPGFVFDWHGSTGWLPLEVNSDHHAYLKVRANGRDAVAMLDMNIPHSAVDAGFARSIGLGAGEPLELGFRRLAIRGLDPSVKDLSGLSAALDHRVEIIVGADVLSGVVADVDLLGHRISLNDPAGYTFPDIARYTHLVRRGDAWLAPVSIEGHKPALFALDLLTSDALQISPDYARDLGVEPSAGATLIADDGAVPARQATLHQIKFAGVVMTGLTADVPQRLSPAYGDGAAGALGVGVLRNYRVIVDLGHARLYTLLIDLERAGIDDVMFTLLNPVPVPHFGPSPPSAVGSPR